MRGAGQRTRGRASARPRCWVYAVVSGTLALSRSDWPHGRAAFPPTRAKPAPLCGGWALALAPVQAPLCGYPRAYWSSWSTPWGTWFTWAAPSQSPLASVSACGENCARSLAPAFPTRPAAARLGSRGGPAMLSQAMRQLRRNYRASYWSSWSTPWGTWFAWASMAWADWIRMLFLVYSIISAATSVSRMVDSASWMFSVITARLLMV